MYCLRLLNDVWSGLFLANHLDFQLILQFSYIQILVQNLAIQVNCMDEAEYIWRSVGHLKKWTKLTE